MATTPPPAPARGLEGVVVAQTELSLVDGQAGRLIVRGHDIRDLAASASFEDAAYLLWYGRLPDDRERETLRIRLAIARTLPDEVLDVLRALPPDMPPLDALRTGLSAEVGLPPANHDPALLRAQLLSRAATLTGRVPAILAAFDRLRRGLNPVVAPAGLGHASGYLYMLHGAAPRPEQAAALDRYMVLLAEHGMNASTFTARVVASTLSDMTSAVIAAIAALKGPLHGGAPALVLDMLQAIGTSERAEGWMNAELARGARLMGFGHRVYRTADPRGEVLRALARQVSAPEFFALARHTEETGLRLLQARKPERKLYANVEFYSAVVLHAAGIPGDMFTATFAAARTAGWTAHVLEQLADNRLIRPEAEYTGTIPSAA